MATKPVSKPAVATRATSTSSKKTITGAKTPAAATGATPTGNVALPTGVGFNTADLEHFVLLNKSTGAVATDVGFDFQNAITDIILQQNMLGVSTITMQLTDPTRQILRGVGKGDLTNAKTKDVLGGFLQQGLTIRVAAHPTTTGAGALGSPDFINTSALSDASLNAQQAGKITSLDYTLVQFVKAADQIQLVFQAETVYRLQLQRGLGSVTTTNGTNVHAWVASMVTSINKGATASETAQLIKNFGSVSVYGPEYSVIWKQLAGGLSAKNQSIVSVAMSRGTTADPYEDTWTAISRIASSIGWRIWENGNVVYFGPDEFWQGNLANNVGGQAAGYRQGVPPINYIKYGSNYIQTIEEFTDEIQLIDFDWDVGKAYGQATVTCMLDNWKFDIGEIVHIGNMGPATSYYDPTTKRTVDGYWMVTAMQRNAFNPQATVTLSVPMPFGSVYEPTSKPSVGFPLVPTNSLATRKF